LENRPHAGGRRDFAPFGIHHVECLRRMRAGAQPSIPRRVTARSWRIVIVVGIVLLLISLIRTAWLSDDAYISFRTADNILHGYGPVWNVDERVQAYTHPLWLAVCTMAFGVTGNVFYTAIVLSILVTLACALLIAIRLAFTPWTLMVCLVAMLSSKAFIDFSTSGLENPLTHLLVLLFMWRWWEEPVGALRVQRLAFLSSLCLLNRVDLAFLVTPALAYETWRLGTRASLRPLLTGLLPFIGWEIFSIVYYGSPVPNTAYAKLNTNMTAGVQLGRGIDYVLRTVTSDPATIPVILLALFAVPANRRRLDWPLVAGIALYCLYVVRVGGDFMMGRFLTPSFVAALALLARARWARSWRIGIVMAATVLVTGLLAPWEPALLSGYGYSEANNFLHGREGRTPADNWEYLFVGQVMDERREYFPFSGLLNADHGAIMPDHDWSHDGARLRATGKQVVVREYIGLVGYFAGPAVHIIDPHALSDPLLARIPGGTPYSVMGHFQRDVPDGYVETVETGTSRLTDPDLAAYYEHLRVIVADPLWSRHRLVTLVRFLAGRDDPYLERYVARK
jgi:arabinofuranosyltransferase